jgi:F-type H+-transporting ATPase subunit c
MTIDEVVFIKVSSKEFDMKKKLSQASILLSGIAISSLAFAEGEMAAHAGTNLGPLAAAIAIGMGAFGAATAQGRAASAALDGVARNPSSRNEVFMPLILSLVFMELQALLCFVIAFMVKG